MGAVTMHSPAAKLNPELRKFTYRDLLEMERAGIIGEDEHNSRQARSRTSFSSGSPRKSITC